MEFKEIGPLKNWAIGLGFSLVCQGMSLVTVKTFYQSKKKRHDVEINHKHRNRKVEN